MSDQVAVEGARRCGPTVGVLGAVALGASAGIVIGRLLRPRREATLEKRMTALLHHLDLARQEAARRHTELAALAGARSAETRIADQTAGARRATRDLEDVRDSIADMIRRAEEAQRAFATQDATAWKLAELQAQRTKAALEQWSIDDGAIHLTPPPKGKAGVSLVTDKDYGNFELMLDWKIAKGGDSGLYLRGQPQIQIWDSDNLAPSLKADHGTGSGGLWNNPPGEPGKQPLKKADRPVGEWNTFHITVVGDRVTVKLNGELVVDKAKLYNFWDKGKPVPDKGPVELQFHGDPLWFKNIYIKELP